MTIKTQIFAFKSNNLEAKEIHSKIKIPPSARDEPL